MMKFYRRLWAVLLSLALMITCTPALAFAEGETADSANKEVSLKEATPATDNDPIPVDPEKPANLEGTDEPDEPIDYTTEEYTVGNIVEGTLEPNSQIRYQLTNNGYSTCHLYIYNTNDETGVINAEITDSDLNVKDSEDIPELFGEESDVSPYDSYEISSDHWCSMFYEIYDDDYLILTSGAEAVSYSFMIQNVETDYTYAGEWNTFSTDYDECDAYVIEYETYEDYAYENNCAIEVSNDSWGYNFDYYLYCEDEIIESSEGYTWCRLEPEYYLNFGYDLDPDKVYYLVIFKSIDSPEDDDYDYDYDDEDYDYDDEDYDDEDYDDEDEEYDFSVSITPKNIRYFDVTGIKNRTYTGKALGQAIDLEYEEIVLGTDSYTRTYSNNKNVGTAKMTIKGVAPHYGTITKTFKINPKGTSISAVKAGKRSFTVSWKKQATQTTGYQIQYSTSTKFTKNTTKTVTIKSNKTLRRTISKLKAKKYYCVRVRTYKTVGKTNYYSAWSTARKIKTR